MAVNYTVVAVYATADTPMHDIYIPNLTAAGNAPPPKKKRTKGPRAPCDK